VCTLHPFVHGTTHVGATSPRNSDQLHDEMAGPGIDLNTRPAWRREATRGSYGECQVGQINPDEQPILEGAIVLIAQICPALRG
jgi:hypothetical protein